MSRRGQRLWAIYLVVLIVAAASAPLWCAALGFDPDGIDASQRYLPPSAAHWLGTDELGRDFLARLFHGARFSLAVGLLGTAIVAIIGVTAGSLAGYFGGRLDDVYLRASDALRVLPKLPLMVVFLAVDLKKILGKTIDPSAAGVLKLVLVVGCFAWPSISRIARTEALRLSRSELVTAARALGFSHVRILLAHVLPNAAGPLSVALALEVGELVIYESVLSFLGLGVPPPAPSWGSMLRNGASYLSEAPWLAVGPGLFTFVTVMAINRLGEGLAASLDPHRPRG